MLCCAVDSLDLNSITADSVRDEYGFRWFPEFPDSDDDSEWTYDLRFSERVLNPCDEWTFPKKLSRIARNSLSQANAGGQSDVSEAASIEFFSELGYTDIIYEMDVLYKYTGMSCKLVDFIATAPAQWECNHPELIKIDGERVGVSVTRAADYGKGFNPVSLLHKKLTGLISARNNVSSDHRFYRSILHIWCKTQDVADKLNMAYKKLVKEIPEHNIKGTIKVITTVCSDHRIYKNNKRDLL